MANYTAADVKKLRELTGAGMMDCKKALDEAEGNVEKAVEALRIKGQKGVAKREGRSAENVVKTSPADLEALLASEIEAGKTVQAFVDEANANLGEKIVLDRFAQFADGFVFAYMHRTMPDLPPQIGVLVELDKADAELAKGIAQHIAAFAPKYLSREDVPAEVVEAERRVAEETTRAEGKPEAALPKIVEGRVNGFFKEATLLGQPYALDQKKSVQKVLDEAGVTLKRFARIKVGI